MFRKKKKADKTERKSLTPKQNKEIKAAVSKRKPSPGIPRTAQQSIPFDRMFEDGTCRVRAGYYTRTIQYWDINYQLAQQEDKTAIFEEWCSFLNFFDSSIHFELSFVNVATDASDFEQRISIPYRQDGYDDIRSEYSQMLRRQLAKGNNGLTKTKFITFGIEAESMKQAKPRLEHVQNDLINNFHRLGAVAQPLNGMERLKLMHSVFHMEGGERFHLDWNDLVKSGLSVKDAIAPTAFAFKNSRTFQMGGLFGAMSFLSITASDLSDQLLKDLLDMDSSQIVTMHIQSVDQNKAIKTVKHTITELDRSKIEEQKKAVRSGYDMDIIPSDLATYGRDAKALLKELQSQNERMFLVTFLILNTGRTEQELETNVFQATSISQKHNCELCRLDFQQEQGLMSSLPLAENQIEIQRGLTTSSTAIFIPFTTQELFQSHTGSLYYGLNALSNNLIMVDRKKLKNPNGLILGTPGAGKSFAAKREITNAFLVTDDDIIICDPEAEYAPLVERLDGQVIRISPSSTQYINPMDITENYSEEDNPIALKADFILSLCELVVGGKEGLQPVEKTVIDRCVHQIYQQYFENPAPENMPLLEDLYNSLLEQEEKEAHHVATALEIYVKGSLNLFNHRTNVDIDNRLVCYDIKELGKQLRCGICGRIMSRNWHCKRPRYKCENSRYADSTECPVGEKFYEDELERVVKMCLRKTLTLFLNRMQLIEKSISKSDKSRTDLETILRNVEKNIKQNNLARMNGYEQYAAGKMSRDAYLKLKSDLNTELEKLGQEKSDIENNLKVVNRSENSEITATCKNADDFLHADNIKNETLLSFIDCVNVYSGMRVEIKYKFSDEILQVLCGDSQI